MVVGYAASLARAERDSRKRWNDSVGAIDALVARPVRLVPHRARAASPFEQSPRLFGAAGQGSGFQESGE